jgi:hypothetical protein
MNQIGVYLASDYLIWSVIWIVYFFSSFRLIDPSSFLIKKKQFGIEGYFSNTALSFFGKRLYLVQFLRPWAAFFEGNWLNQPITPPRSSALRYLSLVDRSLYVFKFTASVNFFLLLFLAPILTYLYGIASAILYIVPMCYVINLLFLFLVKNSAIWCRLNKKIKKTITLDLILFPPSSFGLVNKTASQLHLKINLLTLLYFFGTKENQNKIFSSILDEAEFGFDINMNTAEMRLLKRKAAKDDVT